MSRFASAFAAHRGVRVTRARRRFHGFHPGSTHRKLALGRTDVPASVWVRRSPSPHWGAPTEATRGPGVCARRESSGRVFLCSHSCSPGASGGRARSNTPTQTHTRRGTFEGTETVPIISGAEPILSLAGMA